MTPVDLNRLREALRGLNDVVAAAQGKLPRYRRTIEAAARGVLDAPTVWWCCVHSETSDSHYCKDHDGCGLTNLVPVKGANDGT